MNRNPRQIPSSFYRHHSSSDEDFLGMFWTTDIDRPGRGVALLCLKHKGRQIQEMFVSDRKLHAEEHIVNFLRTVWEDNGFYGYLNIEIFQNYSPCGKCARTYCDLFRMFKENGVRIETSIHFVGLYRIYHQVDSPVDVNHHLNKYLHWKNVQGLNQLAQEGVVLKSFSQVTWLELIGRMKARPDQGFGQKYKNDREKNDSFTKKKLEKVLALSAETIADGLESAKRNNPYRRDHQQHRYVNNVGNYFGYDQYLYDERYYI